MAKFHSISLIPVLLCFLIHSNHALYEDQIGKFDWKKSFIGQVKHAKIDGKRIIIATEDHVLASLNLKTGNIIWRQLLEEQIQYLHLKSANEIVTVSGGATNWLIRTWDSAAGTLLSEWALSSERVVNNPLWFIHKERISQVVVTPGGQFEIGSYAISGENRNNQTYQWKATWTGANCALSHSYYACLTSDYSKLQYLNLADNDGSSLKTVQSKFEHNSQISRFDYDKPAFLINNRLAIIRDDDFELQPYELSANAIACDDTAFELQPNPNPSSDKLIVVHSRKVPSGLDELSVEIDYPIGLGAPTIASAQCKGVICDLLLSSTDHAISLLRLPEGKILWTREEALSKIVASEFLELPVSELDASIEKEFRTSSNDVFSLFLHRIRTQAKQLSNLFSGLQLQSGGTLVRDEFGLHKIIVAATKAGKLFGLDTLTGSIVWTYRVPNIKPFALLDKERMFLFVQRSARYAPLAAHCVLLAADAQTSNAVVFEFDPISGASAKGVQRLNYKIKQAILSNIEDRNNLKPLIIMSADNAVHLLPTTAHDVIKPHLKTTYIFNIEAKTGLLTGYNFASVRGELIAVKNWEVNLAPSRIVGLSVKPEIERVHSQGRVLPDRSVFYKYVNPNLIAVATLTDDVIHKHVLSVYLIDGVTGLILYANAHKRARGPINLVHSENWLVYSFFSERFRRTEVVASELYEGYVQSNSSVFSSLAISQLPDIKSQSYILPANALSMAVTLTERGITNKFVLMALTTGAVIEIPWLLLQPRIADVPCGPEESCIPYMPEIPLPPEATINYNQSLSRVDAIAVAPARLESTSHILVCGLDLFYTRVAPSKSFDVLKEDFDYYLIVLVLAGLIVASYVTKHLASQKALKASWK